jgi:hypothetical protein
MQKIITKFEIIEQKKANTGWCVCLRFSWAGPLTTWLVPITFNPLRSYSPPHTYHSHPRLPQTLGGTAPRALTRRRTASLHRPSTRLRLPPPSAPRPPPSVPRPPPSAPSPTVAARASPGYVPDHFFVNALGVRLDVDIGSLIPDYVFG